MHGELSKIDGTAAKLEEIAPLRNTCHVFLGIAVYFLDVGIRNSHTGQLPTDVRRRQQLFGVQEEIVARDFNAGNVPGMEQTGDGEMKTTEKTLDRHLED